MKYDELRRLQNPFGDDRISAACGLFGAMDTSGRRFGGRDVIRAMANMHDRSNGLGGGFAVYGLYPDYADCYALHVMYMSSDAKPATEELLGEAFQVVHAEPVPTQLVSGVVNPPLVWRYFIAVGASGDAAMSSDDYVIAQVMAINTGIGGAFVMSSGKNMGVFKGVGYPEDIAAYFCLEGYQGYLWTAHGRFPTNTPGWWGGAHPFNILDWTVVHNGEISSYGTNRRYLEGLGYACTLETDTEVIAYAVDVLMRRHNLPLEMMSLVFAPPFWDEVERRPPAERALLRALRQVYSSLLLNGPFTIIIAHHGEMIGLTDRIRLRPLTAATKGTLLYLSSEESAIRLVAPKLDRVWTPMGGEPVVGRLTPAPVVSSESRV